MDNVLLILVLVQKNIIQLCRNQDKYSASSLTEFLQMSMLVGITFLYFKIIIHFMLYEKKLQL